MKILALCLLLAPAVARADGAADAGLTVSLSISDRGAETLDVTLALNGEHGCASAQLKERALSYDVQVCREGGTAQAPVLSFAIERGDARGSRKFKMVSRLASGRRELIGRLQQGGGGTDVTASVKTLG